MNSIQDTTILKVVVLALACTTAISLYTSWVRGEKYKELRESTVAYKAIQAKQKICEENKADAMQVIIILSGTNKDTMLYSCSKKTIHQVPDKPQAPLDINTD